MRELMQILVPRRNAGALHRFMETGTHQAAVALDEMKTFLASL